MSRSVAQIMGALLFAAAIVAITIVLVTAKLGPSGGRDDDNSGHGGDPTEQTDNSGRGRGRSGDGD